MSENINRVQVEIPYHLRQLAGVTNLVGLSIAGPVTYGRIIDELEKNYPALRGTLRDHGQTTRRPLIRFFACEDDWSNAKPDDPLPDAIASGREPFLIIGAIAGG
jgi:sulfur-carrier protein